MFGVRGLPKVGVRLDGPVSIPREVRLQLRHSSSATISETSASLCSHDPTPDGEQSDTNNSVLRVELRKDLACEQLTLPTPEEAASSHAWYGQTVEYAVGVYLRKVVLEPLLPSFPELNAEEITRLLSCNARGQLLFLKHVAGNVQVASIERVTRADYVELESWWDSDNVLTYASGKEWSDWWVQRCHFFDPGCEMIKLVLKGDLLGVAYFERNLVDRHGEEQRRITLIRGIRVNPKINPESIQRLDLSRRQPVAPVMYSGVADLLLNHITYSSLRFGAQGIAVNSPKADSVEDFYEKFMGLPHHVDSISGRRYYRLDDRIDTLRVSFQQQLELLSLYKDQNESVPTIQKKEELNFTGEKVGRFVQHSAVYAGTNVHDNGVFRSQSKQVTSTEYNQHKPSLEEQAEGARMIPDECESNTNDKVGSAYSVIIQRPAQKGSYAKEDETRVDQDRNDSIKETMDTPRKRTFDERDMHSGSEAEHCGTLESRIVDEVRNTNDLFEDAE